MASKTELENLLNDAFYSGKDVFLDDIKIDPISGYTITYNKVAYNLGNDLIDRLENVADKLQEVANKNTGITIRYVDTLKKQSSAAIAIGRYAEAAMYDALVKAVQAMADTTYSGIKDAQYFQKAVYAEVLRRDYPDEAAGIISSVDTHCTQVANYIVATDTNLRPQMIGGVNEVRGDLLLKGLNCKEIIIELKAYQIEGRTTWINYSRQTDVNTFKNVLDSSKGHGFLDYINSATDLWRTDIEPFDEKI